MLPEITSSVSLFSKKKKQYNNWFLPDLLASQVFLQVSKLHTETAVFGIYQKQSEMNSSCTFVLCSRLHFHTFFFLVYFFVFKINQFLGRLFSFSLKQRSHMNNFGGGSTSVCWDWAGVAGCLVQVPVTDWTVESGLVAGEVLRHFQSPSAKHQTPPAWWGAA